jgi:hypothetical protein
VKLFKLFPALFLFALVLTACESDPWIHTGNPVDTDKVVITKVTAYGVQEDGVSPYKGQIGAASMSHRVHEKQGLTCIDCHHKNGNDDRIKQCAKCHNGQAGYETMHGLCVDCHITKRRGPEKCMECH